MGCDQFLTQPISGPRTSPNWPLSKTSPKADQLGAFKSDTGHLRILWRRFSMVVQPIKGLEKSFQYVPRHEKDAWCHLPRRMEPPSWRLATKAKTTQSNQSGPSEHHGSEDLGAGWAGYLKRAIKTYQNSTPPGMEDMRRDGLPIVNNGDFAELDEMSKG